MLTVSIVINCFNGARYLRPAMDSAFAQTYADWEIIFIDNCSTDETPSIVHSYGDRVHYYRTEHTIPLYDARNYAIDRANGVYVAFLDADDLWFPEKLEKQVALAAKGIALVYSRANFVDESTQPVKARICRPLRGQVTNRLLACNFIPMSSTLVRTDVARRLRFNSHYNLLGDHDMWLRLSMESPIDYVDESLTLIRRHGECTSARESLRWIKEWRDFYLNFLSTYGFRYPAIVVFMLRSELSNAYRKYRNFVERL